MSFGNFGLRFTGGISSIFLSQIFRSRKPAKPLRRKLFTPNYDAVEDDSQLNDVFEPKTRTVKPLNKPNENDEVKLKIPIPIFTSLTNKLFDHQGFVTPKAPAPKSKNGIDTPKEDPISATKDTTYSFLKSLDGKMQSNFMRAIALT